jgi:predicted RNase H-like HicB family nuclease
MKIVSFTYELVPEAKGFSVTCLDWDSVFTEGDTYEQCQKNAAEVTEMFLEMLASNSLKKNQHPKFKEHKTSPYQFQLYFNLTTHKHINIAKAKSNFIAVRKERELVLA